VLEDLIKSVLACVTVLFAAVLNGWGAGAKAADSLPVVAN